MAIALALAAPVAFYAWLNLDRKEQESQKQEQERKEKKKKTLEASLHICRFQRPTVHLLINFPTLIGTWDYRNSFQDYAQYGNHQPYFPNLRTWVTDELPNNVSDIIEAGWDIVRLQRSQSGRLEKGTYIIQLAHEKLDLKPVKGILRADEPATKWIREMVTKDMTRTEISRLLLFEQTMFYSSHDPALYYVLTRDHRGCIEYKFGFSDQEQDQARQKIVYFQDTTTGEYRRGICHALNSNQDESQETSNRAKEDAGSGGGAQMI